MQEINLVINTDATISYDVKGVKGKSCKDVTKLIDSLGKVTKSEPTPEMYQQADPNRLTNRG